MKCSAFTNTIIQHKKIVSNCFHPGLKQSFLKFLFCFALFITQLDFAFAQGDGAKIFKQNCSRCHRTDDQKLTGPGLRGVFERVPQPADEWLFKWIKNNKEVLKSGDAYALKMFEENGKQNMDVFDGVISDEDIRTVITYIRNPPVDKKEEITAPAEGGEAHADENVTNTLVILGICIIVLLILVNVLGNVKKNLQDSVNAKKGLAPSPPFVFMHWASNNKRTLAVIGLVLVVVTVRAIYIGVMNIAVYETYKPAQPIKFSHKTHAGKLAINCVYCHSGAEKGKTAGVPSANVCMNCHKAVSEGPLTGKAEIAKIYEAVGWNPAKGTYDESKQHSIEWNRVHALPDFAYFNHSQHVVVGKQDCKNCHGDVATMDEAEQVSPLTMAWCIDCHRKTEVPGMASNPYYEELHAKLKEKYKGESITVEKMGGLDCVKCHY